ncbi:MAG: MFS transporter [Bryobacteraceae bacterium]
MVPLALSLIGELFPYEQRGRPLGWLFGAMAGGMAFGPTVGVLAEPVVGWRALFLGVAVVSAVALALLVPYRRILGTAHRRQITLAAVLQGYRGLLASARGLRTYGYVVANAMFHSGIYTWLVCILRSAIGWEKSALVLRFSGTACRDLFLARLLAVLPIGGRGVG